MEDFLNYVKDIGFTEVLNYSNTPDLIVLTYGYYTLSIYNPEGRFDRNFPRYSLEVKKDFNCYYIASGENKINFELDFELDDLEVLQTEFKDVIRNKKLREIGILCDAEIQRSGI